METRSQNQEGMPVNLRKQLAAAVRSIQWSYAIFWSISPTEPGTLEWGEGYYNGDIKTRKTIQAMDLNDDLIGMQRSEQLRELYESLLAGESNPQTRRPSAALSPEDLSNTEWYYLVCMSFVFNLGQGLPGRGFLSGQPIWLCDAPYADSKVFSRSLLAKSASIQTVVSFPFLGGVVELGVTELVSEDLSLIQHVKSRFLDTQYPDLPAIPNSHANDHILDAALTPLVQGEDLVSPNNSLNSFMPIQEADDIFIMEGLNGDASEAQSWQFMDDDLSNCVHTSKTSSECISQLFVNTEIAVSSPKVENSNDLQDCGRMEMAMELRGDDLHYENIVSSLFKTSHQLILGPSFRNCDKISSFRCWRKGNIQASHKPGDPTPQRMLKSILFEVPMMHSGCLPEPKDGGAQEDVLQRPKIDEPNANHVLSERRRRGKVNERFSTLKSLVPATSKVDKASILDETITYIQELEQRVEELESCQEMTENEQKAKRKPQDMVERTSDNYAYNKFVGSKRKANDIDEGMQESSHASLIDNAYDIVSISMVKSDILIEMKCPWRECLLLEIIDTLSTLRLDSHSIQSSTLEGILSITIRSKLKGSRGLSAGMIRQALERVIQKC
ncbi:endoglucanase 3 [Ancistrocladus abbreviatus]